MENVSQRESRRPDAGMPEAQEPSATSRAGLLAEASLLASEADRAAERAAGERRRMETLNERHRHYAAQLRRNYPGALPDQLVTAIVEGQSAEQIRVLEWNLIKTQVLEPIYVNALSELVERAELAREAWQGALDEERTLRERAAERRREAELVVPSVAGEAPIPAQESEAEPVPRSDHASRWSVVIGYGAAPLPERRAPSPAAEVSFDEIVSLVEPAQPEPTQPEPIVAEVEEEATAVEPIAVSVVLEPLDTDDAPAAPDDDLSAQADEAPDEAEPSAVFDAEEQEPPPAPEQEPEHTQELAQVQLPDDELLAPVSLDDPLELGANADADAGLIELVELALEDEADDEAEDGTPFDDSDEDAEPLVDAAEGDAEAAAPAETTEMTVEVVQRGPVPIQVQVQVAQPVTPEGDTRRKRRVKVAADNEKRVRPSHAKPRGRRIKRMADGQQRRVLWAAADGAAHERSVPQAAHPAAPLTEPVEPSDEPESSSVFDSAAATLEFAAGSEPAEPGAMDRSRTGPHNDASRHHNRRWMRWASLGLYGRRNAA